MYYSVKRSDVTGNRFEWQLGENKLNNTPPPYFIVLASSVGISEVNAIEFHRISIVRRLSLYIQILSTVAVSDHVACKINH